jgi:nucleoside-diphosphate-sugar epimerase
MKILVTGANGYLGTGIVKALIEHNQTVVGTDLKTDRIDSRAEKISANIFEVENPYTFFGCPDAVLHLAWRNGFEHSALSHLEDLFSHYLFLRRLAEAGIRKICVLGSVHEIGFYEGSVNESTPANPQSLYGIGKNALREAVELLAKEYNLQYQWLRGFYIVGNTEYGSSVFSKLAQAEKAGQAEFPFTKGENQFDFLDYDKFCLQVCQTVIQDEVDGIINCCSGRPQRLGERVEQYISENHYHIRLKYGAFQERPYDSKAIWGDDRKIKQIMKASDEKNNR